MLSLKGLLHHIELYVSDLQGTLAFWDWFLLYLGYERYQDWLTGRSYKKETCYIVFVQIENKYKEMTYHRCGPGINHLAFYGGSIEEIDNLTTLLLQKGITILYPEKHPHAGGPDSYAVYFEDPNRMKVEVIAH